MTPATFGKQIKLFEDNRFELLKHLAAARTWNKHPDELLGEKFHPRMLLDAMATQAWVLQHSMSY